MENITSTKVSIVLIKKVFYPYIWGVGGTGQSCTSICERLANSKYEYTTITNKLLNCVSDFTQILQTHSAIFKLTITCSSGSH